MVTLDCAHSFENNSVTASCNIRYQIINELDIFTDATPVEIYVASWLRSVHFKIFEINNLSVTFQFL